MDDGEASQPHNRGIELMTFIKACHRFGSRFTCFYVDGVHLVQFILGSVLVPGSASCTAFVPKTIIRIVSGQGCLHQSRSGAKLSSR